MSLQSWLPFSIDTTCPIAVPSKAPLEEAWPVSNVSRYIETLFLPETLSPLSQLADDLAPIGPNRISEIATLLLSLADIEHRHRKVFAPLIGVLTSAHTKDVREAKLQEATVGMKSHESLVLTAAVGLRQGCRQVVEGDGIVNPRKLVEELERRETLIQIILLFFYLPHAPPPPKKRKRRRDEEPTISPEAQPKEALELLFDRLGVWQAVAELSVSTGEVGEMLNGFWNGVIRKHFLPTQSELCRSFHLKVFGGPYDEPSTKKPRKPKLTRARPSSDAPLPTRRPSGSIPPEENELMRHSISRTSNSERPRSRSASIDPLVRTESTGAKKTLMRAPSGNSMFKGREVGLMRRTASAILRKEKAELPPPPAPSLARSGLLGRKISDKSKPAEEDNNTLVLATPAKPKGMFAKYQPTPIQEETPRPSWIGETPHASRTSHISDTPASRVAATPASRVADAPATFAARGVPVEDGIMEDWENESDDPLAELMVMTDEEDEDDRGGRVTDTPAR